MKSNNPTYKELVLLGKWRPEGLDSILQKYAKIKDTGIRIDFLSKHFLGTPYKESTLIGDINTPEVLVINLEYVDCFTFIDYIESMRMSASFYEFKENLKQVRYKGGKVSFENRNHFFTDWREHNAAFIDDITEQIGGNKTIRIRKLLNEREDGTYLLQGIQSENRLIKYIPVNDTDDSVTNELMTGDYLGIYSGKQGLDVSHVGIIIKDMGNIYLRHASSLQEHRKVVDQNFKDYIAQKLGIIVFRGRK